MSYEKAVFIKQFPATRRFVYHLASYRKLFEASHKYKFDKEPFWVITIDAHLLQSSIIWCMVFGADNTSDIHWKKLSKDNPDEFQKGFRDGLIADLKITWDEWTKYWQEMVDFRNGFAAHMDLAYEGKNVPHFDIALKASYYYDSWVRKIINPDTTQEPRLNYRYDEFSEIVTKTTENLFNKNEPKTPLLKRNT